MAGKDEKGKGENAIQRYFRETFAELKRVSWPTGPEARRLTLIVIVVLFVMAIFLWGVDLGAEKLLKLAVGV